MTNQWRAGAKPAHGFSPSGLNNGIGWAGTELRRQNLTTAGYICPLEVKIMVRFEFYDTNGEPRIVDATIYPDRLRVLLSVFKTHCITSGKAYEFNHFSNWLKKYHNVYLIYTGVESVRIDM